MGLFLEVVIISFRLQKIYAWGVHLFTASGAILGVLALVCIAKHQFICSFWYMFSTILIDAVDGTLARLVDIKRLVHIDGDLLDNIIDYFTYVIVPSFFLWESTLLPPSFRLYAISLIIIASCYQFTQTNAKTSDHFFTGFPSYWNLLVFYLFYYHVSPNINVGIIILLFVFSFIPIKYVYPSRMKYVSKAKSIRLLLFILTMLWAAASLNMLLTYPRQSFLSTVYIALYGVIYLGVSLYRTWRPLTIGVS